MKNSLTEQQKWLMWQAWDDAYEDAMEFVTGSGKEKYCSFDDYLNQNEARLAAEAPKDK